METKTTLPSSQAKPISVGTSSGMGLRVKGILMSKSDFKFGDRITYTHHVAAIGNKAFVPVTVEFNHFDSVSEGEIVDYLISISISNNRTYFNRIPE